MFESIPAQNIYVCPIGVPSMKYLLSICGAIAAIAAVTTTAHSAQASSYSTGNGASSRQLSFQELPNAGSGFYTFQYGGGTLGPLTATNVMGSVGGPGPAVVYSGNFTESTAGGLQCSGSITLTRYPFVGNGNYMLSISKTANSGNGCGFRLNNTERFGMSESVPIANTSGNFTPANSITRFLQNGNLAIWPKWKVVDPTGLNCRNTGPGGLIVGAFPVGTVINGTGFHSNSTWLKTSFNGTSCYVRANTSYIQPVQIPF
jgi:hypothetical protein